MKKIEHYTTGTCASKVTLDVEGTVIKNACFEGGCDGNLAAICKLIAGMDAFEVARRLRGTDCGGKGTSCPDQLAQAIEENIKKSD